MNPYQTPAKVYDYREWFSGVPKWIKVSVKIFLTIWFTIFLASVVNLILISRTVDGQAIDRMIAHISGTDVRSLIEEFREGK